MTRKEQIKEAARNETGKYPNACITYHAFVMGAMWADEHPAWISVEDALPQETNMYIVVHHNVVCTMWWYDGLEEWAEIFVDEYENLQSRKMDGVTHWMPTPQAPKEGGER